jgi:hypothetical protein
MIVELGYPVGLETAGARDRLRAVLAGVDLGVDAPVDAGVVAPVEHLAEVIAELVGVIDREPARAVVGTHRCFSLP